jgi:hypothetical protein
VRHHVLLTVVLLAAQLPACAALEDTPRQAKAREEWRQCEGSFPGVTVKRVEADGRTWFWYDSPSALAAARACITQVRVKNARPGPAPIRHDSFRQHTVNLSPT